MVGIIKLKDHFSWKKERVVKNKAINQGPNLNTFPNSTELLKGRRCSLKVR